MMERRRVWRAVSAIAAMGVVACGGSISSTGASGSPAKDGGSTGGEGGAAISASGGQSGSGAAGARADGGQSGSGAGGAGAGGVGGQNDAPYAGCALNSDCNAPLVCIFGRCHEQCMSSRDCIAGQRCVITGGPSRVCILSTESACVYNADCPAPLVCAPDNQCRNQCVADRDCVSGEVCVGGNCRDLAPDAG